MHRASQVPNRKTTKGFNRTISIDGHVVNRKRPASTISARHSNKRPQVRLTTAMSTLTLSQQNLGLQRIVQDGPSYTTRPSRPSSIVSDTYSETLRRFNAGDTFESKKYMPDTQSIKDPELQKQYLREITEYLKETSYEGPFIRSISMLGNREFQMIFKHLFLRIVPHYSYKRRFEEDAMVLIRQLGYPLADTINRKELLSIGAMHSNPTFIALLHWLVVVCKIMDTPRLSDDEVDEEIDEEAVAQLLHAYAIAGYHKYMTGDDDMASLDQELEHIFERANQPNLHQIEEYTKSISVLEQELAQLESDNGELDTLKERHGVLVKDIGKFKAYIEEKAKKVSKYRNMVERAGEEKKRLEHQLENLNQQIQASRDKLAEKNISEEELVAMYQKTKTLEKEYAELERTAEESRQKRIQTTTKLNKLKEQVEKGVSEYNQKARTVDLSVLEGENILIEYNPLGKTLKEKTSIDIEEQLLPTLEGLERGVTDETAKLLSQTAILRQELDSIKLENSHLKEEIKQQEERVENLKRLYKENHAIFFQEIGKFNKMKDDTVQGWNAKRSIMRKELLDLQDEVRVLEQRLEETNENYRKKRQETERRLQPVLKKVELFFDQASTIADEHHQALKKLHQDICEAFI